MQPKILLSPIVNASSPSEELVLALAAHLEPIVDAWQNGKDLSIEIKALESLLPGFNEQADKIGKEISLIEKTISGLTKDFTSPHILIAAAGIILGLTLLAFGNAIAGFLLFALTFGVSWIGFKKKKEDLLNQKEAQYLRLSEIEEKIKNIFLQINASKEELKGRENSFPEVTHVKVEFSLKQKNILGKSTLIDESGVIQNAELNTIDLRETQSNLDVIAAKLEQLKDVPVLLSPTSRSTSEDAVSTLFGEEDEIQELVFDFTNSLSQVKDVSVSIPLLPNSSELARRYSNGDFVDIEYAPSDLKQVKRGSVRSDEIEAFIKQVNDTKDFGMKVISELKDTFDNLERVCNAYSSARTTSINNIHGKLFDVLNKASWCSKRFYCPRSIQAPEFLQDVLGVHPKQAHRLGFDQLMANLESDKVIAARMKDKPELCDQLFVYYNTIHELGSEIDFDEHGEVVDMGDRPTYIDDRFREALARFRGSLSVIMTGSPNPILNFSHQSELFYDPEIDEWRSSVVPYTYSTSEVLRYGQVLKVTSDLMIPLWEHLWTEKSDFRKSELFRTNESLIRMTEKESEKLIEIANQFRADMRSVRENINLLESDLRSKYDEIVAFRDGMQALGLLSERQKQFLSEERLKSLTLGDKSVLAEGEEHETYLGIEPRVQAERRGAADDPIDLIKSPDILIPYRGNSIKRLSAA